MKTITLGYGCQFSTEMILVNYKGGSGYILLHCIESSSDKECVVHSDIFDTKLDYETFKYIHNRFVSKKSLK